MMKKDATALDFGFLAEVVEQPVTLRLRVGNTEYPLWQRALKRTVDLTASLLMHGQMGRQGISSMLFPHCWRLQLP